MNRTSVFPAARTRRPNVASPRPDGQAGDSGSTQARISGIGPMTRVTTAFGQAHAQTLRERDRIKTKNGDYVAITGVKRLTLDGAYLSYHPGAQPILIRAGAFARGIPVADIMLAPFQRLDSAQSFISPGADKAIDAIHRPHVYRKSESMITYTLLSLARPAAVCCEGLWVDVS